MDIQIESNNGGILQKDCQTTIENSDPDETKDDDDDQENYMDLQEEEIPGLRSGDAGRTNDDDLVQWTTCSLSTVVHDDADVNHYDEPWDLAHKRRNLEERLMAMGFDSRTSMEKKQQNLLEADDRPQEGYDKPWDLQPHMKDDRGQEGYDKPWDLKPHLKDERPAQEYETPWDKKARDIERDLIAAKRAKEAAKGGDGISKLSIGMALQSGAVSAGGLPGRPEDTRPTGEYDEPWDQKKKKFVGKAASDRSSPFQPISYRNSSWGKTIDPKLPLEQQSWYHGTISRVDAENLLRVHREGSYLVRTSESNRRDYSLSVKSIRGFMHMKIVTSPEGRYILGQFSQPFHSIPQMIHHYTVNKLPIKGAEHMSLMYPISNELL